MTDDIAFKIDIPLNSMQEDREHYDFNAIDIRSLRRIAYGTITVEWAGRNPPVTIETETLDYLIQLRDVIRQCDGGVRETFAVSGDYYSNNIRFICSPDKGTIRMYDANVRAFDVEMPFQAYRASFALFYRRAIAYITSLYPELSRSESFRRFVD